MDKFSIVQIDEVKGMRPPTKSDEIFDRLRGLESGQALLYQMDEGETFNAIRSLIYKAAKVRGVVVSISRCDANRIAMWNVLARKEER